MQSYPYTRRRDSMVAIKGRYKRLRSRSADAVATSMGGRNTSGTPLRRWAAAAPMEGRSARGPPLRDATDSTVAMK